MDDLDTLFSRIEQLDLPAGTREAHLSRIARATGGTSRPAQSAGQVAVPPMRRQRTARPTVLAGVAVIAIVTGAWFLFTPAQRPTTASMTQPPSASKTTTSTKPVSPPDGRSLLTAQHSAAELAYILHISPAAAHAGLTRLAALIGPAGRLDPTTKQFRAVAADLGTTPTALNAALIRIKASAIAPGSTKSTGASNPRAAKEHIGQADLLTAPGTAAQLAKLLHISPAEAKTGLARLAALAHQEDGLNPTSRPFRMIAADIGTTPTALNQALRDLKTSS